VVALGVIAGVVGVFVFLVQIPGALVVRLMDDKRLPVAKAQVRCRHQGTGLEMAGETDLFGEAKFPGLERGPWTCTVQPPDRFFSPVLNAVGDVQPRHPAIMELSAARGAELEVPVARPEGGPRAAVAVRAVCDGQPAQGWEARSGLLDGVALLYVPRGASCRVGLLAGELRFVGGKPPALELDCARLPCSEPFTAAPGERRLIALKPTAAQWELARPPPEPESK
jgi:hypothetical protein